MEKLFEQMQMLQATKAGNSSSGDDVFACCSRYQECSNAKACLIAEQERSKNCTYRKNLEAGKIFYGKNAVGFDLSLYEKIKSQVNALSHHARSALNDMIIFFCEYSRGTRMQIVRSTQVSKLSSLGLFDFYPLGVDFPKLCSFNSYLRPMFRDSPLFESVKDKQKKILQPLRKARKAAIERGDKEEANRIKIEMASIPGENSSELLCGWLNSEATHLRDLLAMPYHFAFIRSESSIYVEQLYRDMLLSGWDSRIYFPSPFVEDKLLSPIECEEEETRCVNLSRGYSQEEKSRRLEEIHQARIAREGEEKRASEDHQKNKKAKSKENPFWGKMFIITGNLSKLERREALIEIEKRGGKTSDTPVNSMDVLVLGYQEWSELNGGLASRKVKKAADLQASGKTVEIIPEDKFYEMLGI